MSAAVGALLDRLGGVLTPLHVAVAGALLLWNLGVAGRVSRLARAPRSFVAFTGLTALLVPTAVVVALAASSILYGRTVWLLAWLWPVTLVLCAIQAAWATLRGLVNPVIGVPIAVYDGLLASAAAARFLAVRGADVPASLLALGAAERAALAHFVPAALGSAFALHVPILTPILRARWPASATLRLVVAGIAAAWATAIALEFPAAVRAIQSYAQYDADRVRERPAGDFHVALKLLPLLDGPPPALALRGDLALADTLGVRAVRVDVVLDGMSNLALDSLRRSIEHLPRDSTRLIVALRAPPPVVPRLRATAFDERRALATVARVARTLRPDYLLPLDEPYGAATAVYGRRPPEAWARYLAAAAATARSVHPGVRVGVSAARFDAADSALYAWASAPGSGVDAPGFTFVAGPRGAQGLDAQLRTADRWMRSARSSKEHWVWRVAAAPAAHGERSQTRMLWGVLAWATARGALKGLVAAEAGDYETMAGIRGADRRLRPATAALAQAVRGLEEAAER
ncbi:MAG TPA: hypothetical protein VNA89_04250 [Gemmatimonadaceae bacterium]|nr:hypothetical protein [Gemmatimonadaceae bacterium]